MLREQERYGNDFLNRVLVKNELVDQRSIIFDRQINNIIGASLGVLPLVEQKIRIMPGYAVGIESAQEAENHHYLLDSIKAKMQTITLDNGNEFAKHESISKNQDVQFLLCTTLCVMGKRTQ